MPKLSFLPSTMHVQEKSCVHRILHAYVGWNPHAHELRIDTSTQEQACVRISTGYTRKNMSRHAGTNTEGCSLTFSNFSHPKLNINLFLPLLKCQVFI